ncbi:MAG: segregation/condensation protein A, partial [Elusimicrobiota bacterium]|nr:segregation/condensation protein A [Elusimicrobiota bacterium]
MEYGIKLEIFEGPMDLLLHLIQKSDLDIYDIPISKITSEYITYLNLMKDMNLEVAGDFLIMAATLMRIKSKMLLPQHENEDEEELEDPR